MYKLKRPRNVDIDDRRKFEFDDFADSKFVCLSVSCDVITLEPSLPNLLIRFLEPFGLGGAYKGFFDFSKNLFIFCNMYLFESFQIWNINYVHIHEPSPDVKVPFDQN